MGGSYLGTIEVLDIRSNAGTDIMAAPIQYLGRDAKDMKYRFNWNAPIIWSQHEPNTFYHAAQLLLKTSDLGTTWKEVSPDLTRNEIEKQGKGGVPYTNEAVGAENYGTISYVVESPHEQGVIWVGTDDGLVQITQDGGENWSNVTPNGLQECLVNAIDVSPHDPATAYIATTRYKFNDHKPALYKTSDYGKTWTNITGNIPNGAFTRVVREDHEKQGLLVAGTELGVYFSLDDGGSWHSLQLNLPICPITDLIIKHNDIVAATSGRSFWVLDDIELLRQIDLEESNLKIYNPPMAMLTSSYSQMNGSSPSGTNRYAGVNPATGVVLYYQIPENMDTLDYELQIKDNSGKLIRTISSSPDKTATWAGGPPAPSKLPTKKGLNRFVWDMRHETMPGVPNVYIEASFRGHKVSPGTYSISLDNGKETVMSEVTIDDHPMYPTTDQEYQEYAELMSTMEGTLTNMHQTINRLDEISKQIQSVLDHVDKATHTDIYNQGKDIIQRIKSWDEDMVQRKSTAYDDVENFPNKLTANYMFLINQCESTIPRVTAAVKERKMELDEQWAPLRMAAQKLQNEISQDFNQKLWEAGVGAILIKEQGS